MYPQCSNQTDKYLKNASRLRQWAAQARQRLHFSKCHIVGNHMSRFIYFSEAASDDIVAPAFLKKLESQIVDENDLVMMECDIIGSPQPIISWYCENKALQDGGRIKTSYDGRVARLIMKNASKGDNGKYECVAQSSAGRISCDCILVVKGLSNIKIFSTFIALNN